MSVILEGESLILISHFVWTLEQLLRYQHTSILIFYRPVVLDLNMRKVEATSDSLNECSGKACLARSTTVPKTSIQLPTCSGLSHIPHQATHTSSTMYLGNRKTSYVESWLVVLSTVICLLWVPHSDMSLAMMIPRKAISIF